MKSKDEEGDGDLFVRTHSLAIKGVMQDSGHIHLLASAEVIIDSGHIHLVAAIGDMNKSPDLCWATVEAFSCPH